MICSFFILFPICFRLSLSFLLTFGLRVGVSGRGSLLIWSRWCGAERKGYHSFFIFREVATKVRRTIFSFAILVFFLVLVLIRLFVRGWGGVGMDWVGRRERRLHLRGIMLGDLNVWVVYVRGSCVDCDNVPRRIVSCLIFACGDVTRSVLRGVCGCFDQAHDKVLRMID